MKLILTEDVYLLEDNTDRKLTEEVIREISPQDKMYVVPYLDHYFAVGVSALECIKSAMNVGKKDVQDIKKYSTFHADMVE